MTSLPPTSHTIQRLEHATPKHLHDTTKRLFVGPIPEGWLKSHRKQWYRHYLGDETSKRPTFTAVHAIASEAPERSGGDNTQQDGGRGVENEDSGRPSSQSGDARDGTGTTSTTSLLHSQRDAPAPESLEAPGSQPTAGSVPQEVGDEAYLDEENDSAARPYSAQRHISNIVFSPSSRLPKPRVRFDEESKLQLRARAKRAGVSARGRLRLNKIKDGEVLKTDKMLVRVDISQQTLPEDFDEKAGLAIETKTMDKWREFQVVCRKHTEQHTDAVLQLYQTRVIAATEDGQVKKKPKMEILLTRGRARVNLYSSLDKMLCVWTTQHGRTYIYYLRAESSATSVEWYTYLRGLLGFQRPNNVQVNVPSLSVSLRLDDPFRTAIKSIAEAVETDDDAALSKAVNDESGAAGAIVTRCIDMLCASDEWREILAAWATQGRIGLAWKRYDRLEWIYGAIEQRMYGTFAMQRTHELELRPKEHYPVKTTVPKKHGKHVVMEEPSPIEGFLIRLTSQQGHDRRMGKMLFKRLYFASQNEYLLFLRPAKAKPPPPPEMPKNNANGDVPSSKQIENSVPLSYDVDPYPLDKDNKIAWWDEENVKPASETEAHDRQAADEAERNLDMLLNCDGFINLCEVRKVRKMHFGATSADENLESGSDVDFSQFVHDSRVDDGSTNEVDRERTFEMLMNNGLVVRLQAYNMQARDLWMQHLRKLVNYWRARARADMDLYKIVRNENLQALKLDEKAEAEVGQFAQKWEVTQSFASSQLYNLCGIAKCRAVHMSGTLFRKPRRHTTFTRAHCILSHGHMLVFQDVLRHRSGRKKNHIHHERIASIDLRGCYLYSGTLTDRDLLYTNKTFDANDPGHHALPKIYLEDAWTSIDEDANTTFVIWHPTSKQWFKSSMFADDVKEAGRDETQKRTKLKRVSQLGAKGRSIVFKARSRAERDHWVLSLQVEIERLVSESEEVRIVEAQGT